MHRRNSILVTATALVLLFAVACGPPPSPEEQVSELRSKYSAELNGYFINQEPLDQEPVAEGADADVEQGAEAPAEGAAVAEDEMTEPAATRQDAVLDILVSTTSRETLPGLTVDVTQADAEGNPKESWRVYLDTSVVHRGPGTQITHRLEEVDYQEGDGFNVEVRHPVPPEERSEYREFQEYTPQG